MRGEATYAISSWLFLRALGFIYFTAFVSFAVQVRGLIGSKGLIPAIDTLNGHRSGGFRRVIRLPTVSWINSSDKFITSICWLGAVLAILLLLDVAPLPMAVLLWVLYLSLFTVSGPFLGYQWDILLLEAGFVSIFLAPMNGLPHFPPDTSPSPIIIGLLWWLLFRLMWSSGWTKIASGDRRWRNLTALSFHYETQPLPTPLAWHLHQLPLWFHRVSTALVLFTELVVPFFIIVPALRPTAAVCFIALMLLIQITGNYAFFNLLGMALCLPLLNDAMWGAWLHQNTLHPAHAAALAVGISAIPALFICLLSIPVLFLLFHRELFLPPAMSNLLNFLYPFRLVNSYGLFSVMTIERPELIIETSTNGTEWTEWDFKYKPGEIKRSPAFAAPHQPRLDWQMWFAAMGFYHNHAWVRRLMVGLAERNPETMSLMRSNPFQKEVRYVRCVMFDYRFTTRQERKATGAWWRRERRGLYGTQIEL